RLGEAGVEEGREGVDADDSSGGGECPELFVVQVPEVFGLCACAGVAGDDGRRALLQDVPEGGVRDVRDVDDHAKPVHLSHDFAPEGGEAAVPGLVSGRVGPVVGVVPGEGEVACALPVQDTQFLDRVLDRVPALDADHEGDVATGVDLPDLTSVSGDSSAGRTIDDPVDRIDQGERVPVRR